MPARSHPILRRLLAVAFVVVATLLLLELGLRILDPFYTGEFRAREAFQRAILMPNPARPEQVVLRPGATAEFLGDEYRIGDDGMRAPTPPVAKAEGTYRVLVVGDSIAFGWGVAEGACFPRVLESMLAAGPKPAGIERFEVVNGSCPGWGIANYFTFLRDRGLAYEPDCVVVTFINNDLTDIVAVQAGGHEESPFLDLPSWLDWSYAAWAVKSVHDIAIGVPGDFFRALDESEHTAPAVDAICQLGFVPMRDLVTPRPFVVFDTVGNQEGDAIQHFVDRLEAAGIPRIAGFLPQTNYESEYAITATDMHPNAKGHREFAEILHAWLRENVLE